MKGYILHVSRSNFLRFNKKRAAGARTAPTALRCRYTPLLPSTTLKLSCAAAAFHPRQSSTPPHPHPSPSLSIFRSFSYTLHRGRKLRRDSSAERSRRAAAVRGCRGRGAAPRRSAPRAGGRCTLSRSSPPTVASTTGPASGATTARAPSRSSPLLSLPD
jgi:hypothetical protein